MRAMVAALGLALGLMACGDGGVVLFRVSFGTVSGAPDCRNGQFHMRDQQGLTVVVVITSNTNIVLANGGRGTCPDIPAGGTVSVNGASGNGQITASQIRLY